ncbi:MAG: tetratricopeptide repeat protein [Verrucomicrobia bacterium]|nr:tetratricopeptide repeat protein [Verrucomicrobiota bacterium]
MPPSEIAGLATRAARLAAVVLALAIAFVYANSLDGPFLFDDQSAILRNPTIRQLWPPWAALSPPTIGSAGVVGRPLVNLSLALNYALGGVNPHGYHVFNLLVHVGAALALFGLVRRSLALPSLGHLTVSTNSTPNSLWSAPPLRAVILAFCLALLWALHPLQTESVTFVIQRTESLASLFFLLTLYCFVRAVSADPALEPHFARRLLWPVLSVAACLAGMASKEIVATAPLLVLLYDRLFVAGTWREAWRRRGALHLALASTWLLLAVLVFTAARRGGTAGFGLGVSPEDYLLTQCRALVLYLQLSFWPHPLVVDYGPALARRAAEVWPHLLLLLALAAAALLAARRHPAILFLAAWFLLILAPSSSLVPLTTQTIAEHRMYLPLAALVALVVFGLHRWSGLRGLAGLVALAAGFGWLAARRNDDYASALRLWTQTVRHAPAHPRAHYNLGNALAATGRHADAVRHYEAALRLDPAYSAAHYNLAGTLLQLERVSEAVAHYEAALRLEPRSADLHANLAAALIRLDRMPDAVAHYEAASRLGLLAVEEQRRFARALAEVGRVDDALQRLQAALRSAPSDAETHVLLGFVLSAAGHASEALRHFTEAVILRPDDVAARSALGDALLDAARPAEALSHYEAALRLQPGQSAMLHTNLGNALARLGRVTEAIRHYEEALRLNPDDREARINLAAVRAVVERRRPAK